MSVSTSSSSSSSSASSSSSIPRAAALTPSSAYELGLGYSVLLIILDTSCCERSFALMNRIHTYLRNRLGVATLNNLMCICSLGPSIMNFDPKLILAKWLEAPFMQKNGRGRSLQGKLNALMGAGSS